MPVWREKVRNDSRNEGTTSSSSVPMTKLWLLDGRARCRRIVTRCASEALDGAAGYNASESRTFDACEPQEKPSRQPSKRFPLALTATPANLQRSHRLYRATTGM